jgi:hypothetical protein
MKSKRVADVICGLKVRCSIIDHVPLACFPKILKFLAFSENVLPTSPHLGYIDPNVRKVKEKITKFAF